MTRLAPTKLERHAAKDKAEKHRDDRRIERRQNDRIGQRKSCQQPAATHHQPGLVAVPDGRNGVHRLIAFLAHREEGKEDADAEIEAVHEHIGGDGEGDDARPDQCERGIGLDHGRPPSMAGAGVMPAAWMG